MPQESLEVGAVLGIALVEPRWREEKRIGEGARASQRIGRAERPFLQKTVERRLHRAAPGLGGERAREDERGEVHRRPFRELLQERLVREPDVDTGASELRLAGGEIGQASASRGGREPGISRASGQYIGEQASRHVGVHQGRQLRVR